MNITPAQLEQQYLRAVAEWPFIHDIEQRFNLPGFLLFAVGSRETNLTNEVGDGGHGHGVFQLDDRSHTIPATFDADVNQQATTAAMMLVGLIARFGRISDALAAYNAGAGAVALALAQGRNPDSATTGGDYAADVIGRMMHLAATFPEEHDMPPAPDAKMAVLVNPAGAGVYELQADGGIITRDGAPWPPPPYVAMSNLGNTYWFPAGDVWNYVGLPDGDKVPGQWMVDFAWKLPAVTG